MCVRRVERAIKQVPGAQAASVNLVTQRATVHFDPSRANQELLARAIEDAGYEVPRPKPLEAARTESSAGTVRRSSAAERGNELQAAEEKEQRELRHDFSVALALTLPLLLLGMSHGAIPGADGPVGRALQFALATPVVFGPGRRFLKLALSGVRHRSVDMNSLVSIGVLTGWTYSAVAVLVPNLFPHAEHGVLPHLYFEGAGAIITFVLLGKLLESRARKRLSDAVRGLVSLVPKTAYRILADESGESVPVASLQPGDLLLVRPGERVPTDGEVVLGSLSRTWASSSCSSSWRPWKGKANIPWPSRSSKTRWRAA